MGAFSNRFLCLNKYIAIIKVNAINPLLFLYRPLANIKNKNMKQLKLTTFLLIFLFSCSNDNSADINNSVIDADGNIYNTIKIGNQTWMTENLKTTSFNDNTPIIENQYPDNINEWNSNISAYQWASTTDRNNAVEEELNYDYYGAIYNDAAIKSGKLAPLGWRIPTKQDWIELKSFLINDGNINNEGKVLKSSSGWNISSGNGTDLYGFNALPNGYVDSGSQPKVDGVICVLTAIENDLILNIEILENTIFIEDTPGLIEGGIRCIKE